MIIRKTCNNAILTCKHFFFDIIPLTDKVQISIICFCFFLFVKECFIVEKISQKAYCVLIEEKKLSVKVSIDNQIIKIVNTKKNITKNNVLYYFICVYACNFTNNSCVHINTYLTVYYFTQFK